MQRQTQMHPHAAVAHGHRHAHSSQSAHSAAGALPLSLAQPGQPVRVRSLRGRDESRRFLTELGFCEGAEVSVVCESGGNLIADVKGSRIALSQQMAGKIMVE